MAISKVVDNVIIARPFFAIAREIHDQFVMGRQYSAIVFATDSSSSSRVRYSCGLSVNWMILILVHFFWCSSPILNIELVYQYKVTWVSLESFLWNAKYRAVIGGLSSRWISLRSS